MLKFIASTLFAAILFSSPHALALIEGFKFSGGVYQMNMFTLTRSPNGSSDFFGDTYLPLGLSYSSEIVPGWHFSPSLHQSYITTFIVPKETPEGGAKKNIAFLNLPVVTNIREGIDFKAGVGVIRYEIKGEGGPIQLANGNSTATFYKPSRTVTTQTAYLLLGTTVPQSKWQMDADLMINAPFNKDRRSYSIYFYLTQPLGGGY